MKLRLILIRKLAVDRQAIISVCMAFLARAIGYSIEGGIRITTREQ